MKKALISGVIICLFVWCGSAYGALIHYWDFEDATGAPGTLIDKGTSPAPLTAPTGLWTPGRDGGKALLIQRYVANSNATIGSFGGSFTFETWARWDSSGSNGWAKMFSDWGGQTFLQLGNGTISVAVDANPTIGPPVGWVHPAAGSWFYFAVVANASAGTLTAYFTPDGSSNVVLLGSTTYNGTSGSYFSVSNGGKYGGNGACDWTAVSDTALTEAELTDHMLHGIPEPATMSLLALGGLGVLMRRRRS